MTPTDPPNKRSRWLLGILLFGLLLRVGVAWQRSDELTQDVDSYLGIAAGIHEGRGMSSPGSTQPTAFRPPLYPLLLSVVPVTWQGGWVAILNVVTGVMTIGVTWLLGRQLRLSAVAALLAAGLVAVDPLLVRYSSQPMTESLCALLASLVLLGMGWVWQDSDDEGSMVDTSGEVPAIAEPVAIEMGASRYRRAVVCGLLFGLSVLSRPTFWAFGLLMAAAILIRHGISRAPSHAGRHGWRQILQQWLPVGVVAAVVVAPWGFRNLREMGHFLLTTTHGGYTLILGNNPAYYQEVVQQPLGTVWDGSQGPGQQAWVEKLLAEMVQDAADAGGTFTEVEQDRWMRHRGIEHIADQPGLFVKACLRRFLSFWSIVPRGDAATGLPRLLLISVGTFYVGVFLWALLGAAQVLSARDFRWIPVLLMIAAFCSVHLVYWTDARMRAPIVPMIALLASSGLTRLREARNPRR